jgi:glycosyltransferase involved in cell wall biosynthesis
MRIALLCDPGLVNSNYRAYQPMGVLSRHGHTVRYNRAGEAIDARMAFDADVVHIHRFGTPELRGLAQQARASGIGVVWDNDDDVAALPRANPNHARLGARGRRELVAGITEMVRIAHIVTTPSAVLAERYRELGASDVRVVENYLPREFLGVARPRHDGIVIACLAGLEHQIDYQELDVTATLQRLMERHRDVRVISIGVGHDLPRDRYEHMGLVGFLELARVLAQADIGIAPLTDIPWNRARSNVKLKEYAAAGLCWLASPVGPYVGMGEAQGGRLVADGDWEAALERLIVNGRERRKLAKRAVKWVKSEGIERHAHRWEQALRDAAARAQAETLTRERAPALR